MTSRAALIRRLERDEVRGLVQFAEVFIRVHGAAGRGVLDEGPWAVVALGDGLPINRAIGLANETEATRAQVEKVEAFMRSLRLTPQIEVTDASQEWLAPLLEPRGYQPGRHFMWYVKSEPGPAPKLAAGLTVERVSEPEPWTTIVSRGFDGIDSGEPGRTNRMLAEAAATGGAVRYLARAGREPVAGAAMVIRDRHAMLFSTSVLPAFRRRGVQSALLAMRCQAAADAGCDLISVKVEPGSGSERNVVRAGFEPVCAKVTWSAPEGAAR